jgi:hypothetical protein
MRLRQRKIEPTGEEEQKLADELHTLALQEQGGYEPDAGYWSDLIVRTNKRLDDATSGKAISISWAARVAIPGVIAIIFFFIGLHYYDPDQPPEGSPVLEVMIGLQTEEQDSLALDLFVPEEDVQTLQDVFIPPKSEVADYLVNVGNVDDILGTLSEDEVRQLLEHVRQRVTMQF